MKKSGIIAIILASMLMLTGCSVSTDELLRVPKLPAQYLRVKRQIDQLMTDGVELSTPIGGANRSSVQMIDLDGDGTEEAIAFCSVKTENQVGLRLYIFKKNLRGRYVETACVNGEGDSFSVVEYPESAGYAGKLLMVGWRLGANPVMGMTVYRYDDGDLNILTSEEYTGYILDDFDGDTQEELLLLRHMTSGTEKGKAVLYSVSPDQLKRIGEAPLSAGIIKPESIQYESVGMNQRGIIIDGKLEVSDDTAEADAQVGMMTDLLVYSDGKLDNVTFDPEYSAAVSTFRPVNYASEDIDGDGCIEIPRGEYLTVQNGIISGQYLKIEWCWMSAQASANTAVKNFDRKFTAFARSGDKWMFRMPDNLVPNVTMLDGYQEEGVHSVIFYSYNSETQTIGVPLWEIFSISGSRRTDLGEELGIFELARLSTELYGAKLYTEMQDKIMTYEEISNNFILQG